MHKYFILLALTLITLPFGYLLPFRNYLILFLSVLLVALCGRRLSQVDMLLAGLLVSLYLIMSISAASGQNEFLIHRYLLITIGFLLMLSTSWLAEEGGRIQLSSSLLTLIILMILMSLVITGWFALNDPFLLRQMRLGDQNGSLHFGVGGYEFIYSVVFLALALTKLLVDSKFIYNSKLFHFFILMTSMLAIVVSSFFTAIITLIFGCFLAVGNKARIWFGLIAVSFVIFGSLIINFGLDFIPNSAVKFKLEAILSIDNFNIEQVLNLEFVAGRLDKYIQSLELFFANPVLGGAIDRFSYSAGYLEGFGQHSFIFDTVALFGLIGIAYILLTVAILVRVLSVWHVKPMNYFVLPFFIIALVNNITIEILLGFIISIWLQKFVRSNI